jgi:hypothetical protein
MEQFWTGFEKRAVDWGHVGSTAAELGGLGVLAVPSVQHLRGKPMNENTSAKMELAGLGALASPYVVRGAKALLRKGKPA